MTECGPLVSYEQWDTFKQGSVGRVVDRMEIRIDSNDPENEVGEILVRGMNVMLGYYKNPEATKAVMLPDGGVVDHFAGRKTGCTDLSRLGTGGQGWHPTL